MNRSIAGKLLPYWWVPLKMDHEKLPKRGAIESSFSLIFWRSCLTNPMTQNKAALDTHAAVAIIAKN